MLLTFSACKSDLIEPHQIEESLKEKENIEETEEQEKEENKVILEAKNSNISIMVGERQKLFHNAESEKNIVYQSSDEKIVEVSKKGVIKGIGYGTAAVTATLGDSVCQWKVSVNSLERINEEAKKAYAEYLSKYEYTSEQSGQAHKGEPAWVEFALLDVNNDGIQEMFCTGESTDGGSWVSAWHTYIDDTLCYMGGGSRHTMYVFDNSIVAGEYATFAQICYYQYDVNWNAVVLADFVMDTSPEEFVPIYTVRGTVVSEEEYNKFLRENGLEVNKSIIEWLENTSSERQRVLGYAE